VSWVELCIEVDASAAEALAERLAEHGALAVSFESAGDTPVFDEPDLAPGLWPVTRVSALFEAGADLQRVLAAAAPPSGARWHRRAVADADWEAQMRRSFRPRCHGGRLWVRPSWSAPAADGLPEVVLDPGMAFGTGMHATTALCLDWLAETDLAGARVIDYGCGSGILAIAAARLGAGAVLAVDIDAQALAVARANVAANAVAERVQCVAPAQIGEWAADLLVANILLRPLVTLAPRFAALLVAGGRIALSGLTAGQVPDCAAALRPGFALEAPRCAHGWALLPGRRLR